MVLKPEQVAAGTGRISYQSGIEASHRGVRRTQGRRGRDPTRKAQRSRARVTFRVCFNRSFARLSLGPCFGLLSPTSLVAVAVAVGGVAVLSVCNRAQFVAVVVAVVLSVVVCLGRENSVAAVAVAVGTRFGGSCDRPKKTAALNKRGRGPGL
jgi:hypothetical protein